MAVGDASRLFRLGKYKILYYRLESRDGSELNDSPDFPARPEYQEAIVH